MPIYCYLWQAAQSEPGMRDVRYDVTASPTNPPKPIGPMPAGQDTGLAYDESFYGDWRLLGRVDGNVYTDAYGEVYIIMPTPAPASTPMPLSEVARAGWYAAVKPLHEEIREQADYVDYLELTKRDKKRIAAARRRLEVLHAWQLQGHEYAPAGTEKD